MTALAAPAGRTQAISAMFVALAMVATVGGALAFQHIGGYIPCKLCLGQRLPYYLGAPVMLLAAASAMLHWPPALTRLLLLTGGLLMLWSLYLGAYHAGVEWAWWAGPTDCSAVTPPADTGGNGVLDAIDAIVPPSCDKAALTVAGLSLAGWNAIASAVLAVVAFRAALAGAGTRHGSSSTSQ